MAGFVELPEDDVKDLMCRARQPVSLEMKVGDGDDTELELLSEMVIFRDQVEEIVLKAIYAASWGSCPICRSGVADALRHGW